MSNYVKLAADAGDQYLSSLSEMQDAFLKTAASFAEKFKPATPVATVPAFTAPELPTAEEITEATFAFAQKLLKQQKTFAEKMLAASTSAAK